MKNVHTIDITHSTKEYYRIDQPGNFVYIMKNRSGNLTFEINHENTHVEIYGIFEGFQNDVFALQTKQIHQSPHSTSSLRIKSVLWDNASLEHNGSIVIQQKCDGSNATFESRHLLMGAGSRALAKPQLEILAEDVACSHAVATGPPNKDIFHYLLSRGIPIQEGKKLIASGFLKNR